VLPAAAKTQYREKGWVSIEGVIDPDWIGRLRCAIDQIIAASATSPTSTEVFDLDEGR
jgi:hypothetical protein